MHVWRIAGSRVSCRRVNVERPPNINHDASTSVGSLPSHLGAPCRPARLCARLVLRQTSTTSKFTITPRTTPSHPRIRTRRMARRREPPAARLKPPPTQAIHVAKPSNEQANGLKGHIMTHGSCDFAPPRDLGCGRTVWSGRGGSAVHRRLGVGCR
ncbi:hypothetical protein DFP72DRAFT_273475 [Ephemerocybe angulata]|uniref:Uncharacterized protein n=1 Tax=Ephemerocybe angulata TaxID=980116 RepID=A0A8H6M5P0_9AGAR|nr:hypothetical protein DFP72DRAFT_273475 [Tulosesus angulatus]